MVASELIDKRHRQEYSAQPFGFAKGSPFFSSLPVRRGLLTQNSPERLSSPAFWNIAEKCQLHHVVRCLFIALFVFSFLIEYYFHPWLICIDSDRAFAVWTFRVRNIAPILPYSIEQGKLIAVQVENTMCRVIWPLGFLQLLR